jgi:hypothetical protein
MKQTRPSLVKTLNPSTWLWGQRLRQVEKALFALATLLLLACLPLAGLVLAQASTDYDQSWHVLSGAGAPASSTNFAVNGSLSQLVIGTAEGSSYSVESGYWYGRINCIISGDLDCNCEVNIADVMLVANLWRCRSGDECYNDYCDIDEDGDIDVVDIMLVVKHWGNTCE